MFDIYLNCFYHSYCTYCIRLLLIFNSLCRVFHFPLLTALYKVKCAKVVQSAVCYTTVKHGQWRKKMKWYNTDEMIRWCTELRQRSETGTLLQCNRQGRYEASVLRTDKKWLCKKMHRLQSAGGVQPRNGPKITWK